MVWQAAETLRETTETIVEQSSMNARFAGAAPFLMAFARLIGGHAHLVAARSENENGPRTALASFYITRLLPEHASLAVHAVQGDGGLYDLSPEDLAS